MSKTVCAVAGCESQRHGRGVCRSHYMKCWRGQMLWPEYIPDSKPSENERFWAKVDIRDDNECWEWSASLLPNGYGQFAQTTAHRFSMIASGYAVSSSDVVDHLCRNRKCVNPSHLEVVSQSENVVRGYAGNVLAASATQRSLDRTHCKHGHELTPENTYRPPSYPTWRACRECRRAGSTAASARRRMRG